MGFTGSLILARTPLPLTDLDPLAGTPRTRPAGPPRWSMPPPPPC